MSDKEKEAQVWLAFATAAVAGYSPDEDLDTFEDLIEDICDVATTVADNMISEYAARFGARDRTPAKKRARTGSGGGGRSRGGRARRPAAEEEDADGEEE